MTQTHYPSGGNGHDDGPNRDTGNGSDSGPDTSRETTHDDTRQLHTPTEQLPVPPAPIWYGEDTTYGQPGLPAPHGGQPAYSGSFGPYADPARSGADAGSGSGSAYGTSPGHPAGPFPPAPVRQGAEPAQPAQRRRWWELPAVAVLAAVLASGGTYAATQLGSDQTQTSSTASTSSDLGRGTDTAPVSQADASAPNWTATAAAVSPSVVSIDVKSQSAEGQGSGVVIDDQGHILTNNHVATGAGSDAQIMVTLNDGRSFEATIAGTDPSTDLAVITLTNPPDDLEPIALGDSESLAVGDPVMAVGNPLGLAGTVTTGIVSALNRPVQTQAEEQPTQEQQNPFGGQQQAPQTQSSDGTVVTNAIQTSAAINPGNSGGALVNASGQLVGINSSIATLGSSSTESQSGSIGIGFAIPANEAKTIAAQLIDKGTAEHAFLGVTSQDGTAKEGTAERAGATIVSVSANTPASEAGLEEGDTIVAIDDEPVSSSTSLVAHVRERGVGDQVKLTVLRDGESIQLDATLTAKADTTN